MLPRRSITVLCGAILTIGLAVFASGQSTVTELNDAGWKALREGQADRAVTHFLNALALRPSDPVLLFGAGAAFHAQGKQRDAMARLRKALEIDPALTAASELLGRIAFDEGEADLAIKTYENALKRAPGNAAITQQLNAWRKDAGVHQTFDSTKYDRFRVMFEGRAEEALAKRATAILDSAFWRITRLLGEYPTGTIVTILYTEQQFHDITRAPGWAGGQYDGRIRIPVAGAAEKPELFERVLTHELSHAIVAAIAPHGVPAWLNEGMAQYFDGSDVRAARQRLKAAGQTIPLKVLGRGFGRMNAYQAQIAYDESLVAANVMFDRPGFGWIRLLHRLGDGQTFEEAIVNFGFSYDDLEAPFKS